MTLKIKEARKLAGLTQKELAKQIGVSAGTLSDYESGNHEPKSDILCSIAEGRISLTSISSSLKVLSISWRRGSSNVARESKTNLGLWQRLRRSTRRSMLSFPFILLTPVQSLSIL